ncbi:MAG TPA: ABC transporter permease [Vicinamibacteria bacterium]|nr:ABC transporter permease [Vicinamibacteria bacterium]
MGTTLAIALQALGKYRLRAALALLGVAIGVSAVVTTIALGQGAQAAIRDQIRAAGLNVIVVKAGNYRTKTDDGGGVVAPHASLLPRWLSLFPVALAHFENDPMEKHDHPTAAERLGDAEAGLGAAATLTREDAEAIAAIEGVQHVASGVHENARVHYGDRRWFTRLHGTDVDLPKIRRAHNLTSGRFFAESELRKAELVMVLGSVVRDKLFGEGVDPVGETITLWNQPFEIVGVTSSSNWMSVGSPGDDNFDAVYVPFTTIHRLLNVSNLNTITVTAESSGEVSRIASEITELLRLRHTIEDTMPDDFTVSTLASEVLAKGLHPSVSRVVVGNLPNLENATLEQLSVTLERSSRTMTALLAAIAAVSLVVGGIGITNVMLLSVTERTREIGLRLSVGARASQIREQFAAEAILLGLAGGVAGLALGAVACQVLQSRFGWATELTWWAVLLAFGVAAGIGLLSGFYPAKKASALDPIVALRYE